jgi:hypothetical protein
LGVITWHVDAAFAVHQDFKSHTGATMTLGKGAIQSSSTKQKVNSRSSTEAELVAMDDVIAKVLWTKQFLEGPGYKINQNIVLHDNQSTMKLEQNGKASSGKRKRMIADYMTKPLTGSKFNNLRNIIMNNKTTNRLTNRSVLGKISDGVVSGTGHP